MTANNPRSGEAASKPSPESQPTPRDRDSFEWLDEDIRWYDAPDTPTWARGDGSADD